MKTLELKLNRIDCTDTYTGGVLSVQKSGVWVPIACTLEDPIRELGPHGEGKIWGNTGILAGRYLVKLTLSKRFGRVTPELMNVKFFAGIRIHVGNWTKDTDGCILVGLKRNKNALISSASAVKLLMDLLEQAGKEELEVYITIENQ